MTISIRRRVSAACLVLLSAAAAASAQTTDTVTNVPFRFTVGRTTLPRDRYTVSRMPGQNGAFLIRGERQGVVILSQPDAVADRDAQPSLIFYRYADQYFLREIRLPGSVALRLPKTRAEVDAAESMAQHTQPELVVLPPLAK